MAYQKKCYRSTAKNENRHILHTRKGDIATHQSRGGGDTTRKNNVHRYATRPVETPISPTYIKATEAKKLKV